MVDMEPAVGRICLLRGRSTEVFPWYEKGGKITRIAGKRAYFIKEDGTESFSHEFSAIVDTPEEEKALLDFAKIAKARLKHLLAQFDVEAKQLEEVLNSGSMKSISIRRVRAVDTPPKRERRVRGAT
jgi:hypothetical protein